MANNPRYRRLFLAVLLGLMVCLTSSCIKIHKGEKGVDDGPFRDLNIPEEVYIYEDYLKKPPLIKVLLLKDVKEVDIAVASPFKVYATNSPVGRLGLGLLTKADIEGEAISSGSEGGRHLIGEFINLSRSSVRLADSQITIGAMRFGSNALDIVVEEGGEISLNSVNYRGVIRFIPQLNDTFLVVEELDLEDYISGVLGSEMLDTWEGNALFAQSVAARTYALYKKKRYNLGAYHIDRVELAYNGRLKETRRIRKIVDKSRGIIMVYDWLIFPGYFHSTCGGHTEDVRHIFKEKGIPSLSGVDCGYCGSSKYFRWQTEIDKGDIAVRLKDAGIGGDGALSIRATDAGPGGHAATVEITDVDGKRTTDANRFRLLIGANRLFSTAFTSSENGQSIIFAGRGWGHGVGLCQYGAQGMAQAGFKWHEILRHYYPGIELVKIY